MWAKWLHNPYHVGGPQHLAHGQNQKWLHNPCKKGPLGMSFKAALKKGAP